MLDRLFVTSTVLGVMALAVPTPAEAQSCEDCGMTTQRCLEAVSEEVVCIEFNWPDGEETCDSWEQECSPDLHAATLDIVGMPSMASLVAFEHVTSDAPAVRNCDRAVLRFVFERDRLLELREASDQIVL